MIKQYCDLCGDLTEKLYKENLTVSLGDYYRNRKPFEICECCKEELRKRLDQAEVEFVENSKLIIQNGINYGEFIQVGTCEQGGMMCPRCGYSNNSYTFKGVCQKCGYTKIKEMENKEVCQTN